MPTAESPVGSFGDGRTQPRSLAPPADVIACRPRTK